MEKKGPPIRKIRQAVSISLNSIATSMKRIVVIGPESTGKSTLCQDLAEHYQTAWVPEYAREYLLKHGTNYSFNDLLTIARGQIAGEDKIAQELAQASPALAAVNPDPLLFIDTDLYVMKVWCEFVFDKCHNWILDGIATRRYDLYLLCNVDLPWTKDELREYPDLESRLKLYHIYKDLLINQSVPWATISGNNEERLAHAIAAVEKLVRS